MENNQQLQPVAEQKIEDLVPELVLEPYVAEQALAEIKNEEKDPLASVNAESLTPEELQAVEAFSKKLRFITNPLFYNMVRPLNKKSPISRKRLWKAFVQKI